MTGLPVPDAARMLNVRPGTLRRWIRQGCPVVERGRRGRGHAERVDPAAVAAWSRLSLGESSSDRDCLMHDLEAAIPGLVAEASLQALADASPLTQGGAELGRLRNAVGASAQLSCAALLRYMREKSKRSD